MHRLVALAFIPNPDPKNLTEVDHIDNNALNNNVENLQWISSFDNKSKIPYKTRSNCRKGERNGRATVTDEQVREIRKLYKGGIRISELSRTYNLPYSTMHSIVHYNSWKDVSD